MSGGVRPPRPPNFGGRRNSVFFSAQPGSEDRSPPGTLWVFGGPGGPNAGEADITSPPHKVPLVPRPSAQFGGGITPPRLLDRARGGGDLAFGVGDHLGELGALELVAEAAPAGVDLTGEAFEGDGVVLQVEV